MDLAQDPGSAFGKVLRIDPLDSGSANGECGIPADTPFAGVGDAGTLGEIFAYGSATPSDVTGIRPPGTSSRATLSTPSSS